MPSKFFLEAVFGLRHVPKFFWRLSEAPGTFQNFFGGCPRLRTRSKIFLEAVRGSRHVPKFFWRLSEAPDTFQNFFGGLHTGGGRPPSKGLDFVRPFSRSADLERARLCPRLIKWFDMLILSLGLVHSTESRRKGETPPLSPPFRSASRRVTLATSGTQEGEGSGVRSVSSYSVGLTV